ncbi:hypothetical protein PQX77_005661 [Marasmius sp. AFHP31]|nr:hypothetical protein PQX77_005661 [Marasmius sp. AFHP31]
MKLITAITAAHIMLPESQFASVLHTNYIPSTRELGEIRRLVLDPQGRVRKDDEDIARLRAERHELQQFVNSHSALAVPSRRLSVDIWAQIFVHCMPRTSLNVAVCTVREAPLLLTTVCRTWREIALNTPRLWSCLHINIPRPIPSSSGKSEIPNPDERVAVLEGIKLWLSRSGSRPLTLSVETTHPVPPRWPVSLAENDLEPNHCADFLGLLAEYSHRWKVLSLGLAMRASYQWPIDRLTADEVPLLETVYTGESTLFMEIFRDPFPSVTIHSSRTPAANLLCRAPSLRALHINPGSVRSLHIPLGWARLTELNISLQRRLNPGSPSSESPIIALQTIAETCSSLATLTFRCDLPHVPTEATPSSSSPIEWSSLRDLNLLFDGQFCNYTNLSDSEELEHPDSYPFDPSLKSIYSSIRTPHLLRLTLQLGHCHWGDPASGDILPFDVLLRSSPRLTHLQLIGYHILAAKALSQCLQSTTSSLSTLKLQPGIAPVVYPGRGRSLPPPGWVSQFLTSLNNSGAIACPQLESFDCGWCSRDDIPSILEFLQDEGRRARLRYFKADMGELWGEEVDALTSAGLAETLQSLRTVNGILSVDLEWNEVEPLLDTRWQQDSHGGLPTVSPWEGSEW